MDTETEEKPLSKQLESAIKLGNYLVVQHLLQGIKKAEDIQSIEDQFSSGDPVILSVDCREEEIAWYLIEKGFTYNNTYKYPDIKCDEWCNADHGPGKCPVEYEACDLAKIRGLAKVTEVIEQLQQGYRKPGDGLSSQQGLVLDLNTKKLDKKFKGMAGSSTDSNKTAGQCVIERFDELYKRHESRGYKSLIHECVDESPMFVFLCAAAGVPINYQNAAGLSALHLAVKYKHANVHVAEALLMCGADLSLRNEVGQTPMDFAAGDMKDLLERFKPGLPVAVTSGDSSAVIRLTRLWCHPYSNIKNGKTAMEICENNIENPCIKKCYNQLQQQKKTLELVHSVLREDINNLKRLLRTESGYNVNARYRDKHGRTPISSAIDQRNLEITQLLLDTGKVALDIRVRETERAETTVPLCYKALHKDCPQEIWRCLSKHIHNKMLLEKDIDGNTAILRALNYGKDSKFIEALIRESAGRCLVERNQLGQTTRELAMLMERQDVVAVIDNFVMDSLGKFFLMTLPVNFYGLENLDLTNESDMALKDLVLETGVEDDIQAVCNYGTIELYGRKLFRAAATGDVRRVSKYNKANYRDLNGYTALTRAIVFDQLAVVQELITQRPALKTLPDNCNRYPLHYAYALPEEIGTPYINILLQRNPEDIDHTPDKDGILPSEYRNKDPAGLQDMIDKVKTLDAYGKDGFLQGSSDDSIVIWSPSEHELHQKLSVLRTEYNAA